MDTARELRKFATDNEVGMLEQGATASPSYRLMMNAAAEIERLRAALKPFAQMRLAGSGEDSAIAWQGTCGSHIYNGDIRNAREAHRR